MQTMQYTLKEGIPFIFFLVLFTFLLSFRAVEGVDHEYLPAYIQHLEPIEVISSVQPSEYFFLFLLKVSKSIAVIYLATDGYHKSLVIRIKNIVRSNKSYF